MPTVYDIVHRLEAEPSPSDPARGFGAGIADPAWLLGRQWQLGEHQGEDASSPVGVSYDIRLAPVRALDGADPQTTPAEAIVESEPGDFWTAGRRVATGRLVAAAAQAAGRPIRHDPALRPALPNPYDIFDGQGFDGRTLWEHRAELDLDPAWFGTIRPPEPEPKDLWDPAEFCYHADFAADANYAADGTKLLIRRHDLRAPRLVLGGRDGPARRRRAGHPEPTSPPPRPTCFLNRRATC